MRDRVAVPDRAASSGARRSIRKLAGAHACSWARGLLDQWFGTRQSEWTAKHGNENISNRESTKGRQAARRGNESSIQDRQNQDLTEISLGKTTHADACPELDEP